MNNSALNDLMRLLFPTLCVGCGQVLVGSERQLCARCLIDMPLTHYAHQPANYAERRLGQSVHIEAAMALLYFRRGELGQRIVHNIKYHGNSRLALAMGRQMGFELQSSGRFADVDLLLPVPLHFWRQMQRGYNQSRLLCEGIASVFATPIGRHLLRRTRYTGSQTHKNRALRQANMEAAFGVAHPGRLQGHHVLLVDDVMTTGATLAACSRALLQVPGVRVSVATLAVTE